MCKILSSMTWIWGGPMSEVIYINIFNMYERYEWPWIINALSQQLQLISLDHLSPTHTSKYLLSQTSILMSTFQFIVHLAQIGRVFQQKKNSIQVEKGWRVPAFSNSYAFSVVFRVVFCCLAYFVFNSTQTGNMVA